VKSDSSRPPREVQLAIKLSWLSVGLRVLVVPLLFGRMVKIGLSGSMLVAAIVVSVLVLSLTVWLIRKISARRNWARMTLAVMVLLSIPYFATTLSTSFGMSFIAGVLFLLAYGTKYLAAALLFVGRSTSWFRHAAELGRQAS